MKRIILPLGMLLIAVGFILGRVAVPTAGNIVGYIPPLRIVGDVKNSLVYSSAKDTLKTHEIQHNNQKVRAIKLEDLIHAAKPISEGYDLLLIGEDGLISNISGNHLEECYIAFTKDNGWEAINYRHPISSNIKRMKEIVIVSKEQSWDYGLNIIEKDKNILNITPGQLYLKTMRMYPYFEGKSSVDNNDQKYETGIYTLRKTFQLSDVVEGIKTDKVLLMGEQGDFKYDDGSGIFEVKENDINYIFSNGKEKIESIVGVCLDPPIDTVMDTYYDTLHYLKNNEKVLVLYLDGFGYHQYRYAIENDYAPTFYHLPKAKKAVTIYQPVTNAGFAAMITGKNPTDNGIFSRKQRDLKVPSFFAEVNQLNKKASLIEGNIGIINTEVNPILCNDKNGNGSTDDEIFQTALNSIDKGLDLIFVHFHGIDDSGHTYGDLADETMKTINRTDGYVKRLVSNWSGKIIITSDHGMHVNKDGGGHGVFRYEDLMVPYMVIEGKGK